METKLYDVLHLYLGCETTQGELIEVRKSGHITTYKDGKYLTGERCEIKPILRPISDMNLEEAIIIAKILLRDNIEWERDDMDFGWHKKRIILLDKHRTHEGPPYNKIVIKIDLFNVFCYYHLQTTTDKYDLISGYQIGQCLPYLFNQCFDIFGLIESGQAIDKTKI